MAELRIRDLRKRFGSVEVLHGINLAAVDGEFLVLVGPSGCGKSTLLNIIAGLDSLSDGEIEIDGEVVNDLEPKERNIAMVFQSYALYPSMTVEQNIGFSLEMSGVERAERRRRVAAVAELLRITPLLSRRPSQLSGGQRQRVAMGRALVREPKLFLFDEPLSNLDAQLRVEMRTEIKKLHQRLGTTIVYVTHDQVEAMTMATRIAVMKEGVLQQFGTPSEIYERPANTFVATFMGSPAMNLVPATVMNEDGQKLLQLRAQDGAAETLPVPPGYETHLRTDQSVLLGLRPECFIAPGSNPGARRVAMEIDLVEPTGPDVFVAARMAGVEIMARLPAGAGIRGGEKRAFEIEMGKAVLFDGETGEAITRLQETPATPRREEGGERL